MKLFYYHEKSGNFGDDLNAWLWDALLPGWQEWDTDVTLIGVGTILNAELDLPQSMKLVIGSGYGYGDAPDIGPNASWDIRSVRGPETARQLGLSASLGIIDPAIMISQLDEFKDIEKDGKAPLFVPHHSNVDRHPWERICGKLGIEYLSPKLNDKLVIRKIAAAPLVIAESMHAAIIADTFRVPWIPVDISGTFNYFKWNDFAKSVDVELRVEKFFPAFTAIARRLHMAKSQQKATAGSDAAKQAPPAPQGMSLRKRVRIRIEGLLMTARMKKALSAEPHLSDPGVLSEKISQYENVLSAVRRDYEN